MSARTACACFLTIGLALIARAQNKDKPTSPTTETPAELKTLLRAADVVDRIAGKRSPEAVRVLAAIERGNLGAGGGWFDPAKTRYTLERLARSCGVSPSEGIPRDKVPGEDAWFARLDRNRNGRITADDLDWSDNNAYVQQASIVTRLFRRMDGQGDGRLTREELQAYFDRVAAGKNHLTVDDLREALLAGSGGSFLPGDAPTQEMLVRGLFDGELGSAFEGPRLEQRAPDFTLKTHDGKRTVKLSEAGGGKPIVLVFGNFTCAPFRALYPTVDELARRYRDEAVFLGVYVREAHPTDGWRMVTNDKLGVSIKQPVEYGERVEVATRCFTTLKYSVPLLVDGMDDRVGHAYSGMPSRIYVIDRDGKVAYKGGRGPFGFRPGEAEQALVMLLIDQHAAKLGPRNAGTPRE